jgi:hypothetical protein
MVTEPHTEADGHKTCSRRLTSADPPSGLLQFRLSFGVQAAMSQFLDPERKDR